ncbi:MAG: histidinol-phosphate aminotransferase family protein, partial [Haemophilus parainfluenzae]|nr:histidinol-phosphate aminotransferase family protein [Haemophilus parainfluenzae]
PKLMAENQLPKATSTKVLHLNFNENALGMSEKAKQAIVNSLAIGSYYPDDQRAAVITQLAVKHNVAESFISLGNGSSENIQAAVQALIVKAQNTKQAVQLVVPDPTFNYAELYAKALGVPVMKVPLADDFSFDLTKLKNAAEAFDGVTIFYLCNPNNPTSMITPAKTLFPWIKSFSQNSYFLLDEAYADFVEDPAFETGMTLVKEGLKNVLVTRTFSKFYALAGYRVGYLLAQPEVVEEVEKFMSLDNTNLAGAVAAVASLQDKTFAKLSFQSNSASRQIVQNVLTELGLKFAPSNGNFIFHEIKGDVKTYQERMKAHSILVGREFLPIQGWNRLTLGTPDEMKVFVKVLKAFRAKGWV